MIKSQKKLDAIQKAFQQIEFVRQLQKLDNTNANAEFIFVLRILEKIKEMRLKFFQGSTQVL